MKKILAATVLSALAATSVSAYDMDDAEFMRNLRRCDTLQFTNMIYLGGIQYTMGNFYYGNYTVVNFTIKSKPGEVTEKEAKEVKSNMYSIGEIPCSALEASFAGN